MVLDKVVSCKLNTLFFSISAKQAFMEGRVKYSHLAIMLAIISVVNMITYWSCDSRPARHYTMPVCLLSIPIEQMHCDNLFSLVTGGNSMLEGND